jgi:hypothetical protein
MSILKLAAFEKRILSVSVSHSFLLILSAQTFQFILMLLHFITPAEGGSIDTAGSLCSLVNPCDALIYHTTNTQQWKAFSIYTSK